MKGMKMTMMKRFTSLLLVLTVLATSLFGNVINVQARDTEGVDLETVIRDQIMEYTSTFDPGDDGANDGVKQLLNHAVNGKGEDLNMDEDDVFTAMMLNSVLWQEGVIESIETAVRYMQTINKMDKHFYRGGMYWYGGNMRYALYSYDDNENDISWDDPVISGISAVNETVANRKNEYDDGMLLVAGSSSVKLSLKQTEQTEDSITYKANFSLWDNFDFDNSYKITSASALLAQTMTWFGQMLSLGLIDEYSWSSSVEFEITIPYSCDHQTADYRWEYDGTNLVSITDDGLRENNVKKIQKELQPGTQPEEYEDGEGVSTDPYYKLQETVRLQHNLPWVVEFRMSGNDGGIMMGPTTQYTSGMPYLLKTSKYVTGGDIFQYTETDSETGKESTMIGRSQYGIKYDLSGYLSKSMHTYRLENRIAEDGSNMVYLLIDGKEIGALDTAYLKRVGENVQVNGTSDWFNGKDISINYIFNENFAHNSEIEVEYIQIWENGENAATGSFYEDIVTEATCLEEGYTTHTCTVCKETYTDTYTDIVEHVWDKGVITEDNLLAYTCEVCGTTKTEELSDPNNPFVDVNKTNYYYDAVIWALENDVTQGMDATHFRPALGCTRAQVVTFLWRVNGKPEIEVENPFTDVDTGDYYYDAVLWAVDNGITKGTTETTFGPNDTCTRAQVVTFLWRANEENEAGIKNPFTDVDSKDYYYDAVLWAVDNEITKGTTKTTFSPNDTCTRAEVVTFLYRAQN